MYCRKELRVGCCGCSISASLFYYHCYYYYYYYYYYYHYWHYFYCWYHFFISITIRIFIKSSLLFLGGRLTAWFCFFHFLHVLTWSTRPPFGVDALDRYYQLASFNYGDMKARDIAWIVDVIWAILCLISPVIIEMWGKIKDFFSFSLLRGVGIMFDNNCGQHSQCWLCNTNERGKS